MIRKSNAGEVQEVIAAADLLVLAGGYEDRARFTCENVVRMPTFGVMGIEYQRGPAANRMGAAGLNRMAQICRREGLRYSSITYTVDNPLAFEAASHFAVQKWKEVDVKRIVVDVSGMAQYVLMQMLAELREMWPRAVVTIIYVAAKHYPPDNAEIRRWFELRGKPSFAEFSKDLVFESAEPLCPNRFSGTAQGRTNSAMILFAGYEKHRSHAAYDSVNPCRLVCFHSRPHVEGGDLRLRYSRAIHEDLGGDIERSSEVVDNLDIGQHLKVLSEYYDMLYDLHDIVLVPVHSKMQSIACFLFWERFPDVQVMFPLPLGYSEAKGGSGIGVAYMGDLPSHPRFSLFHTNARTLAEREQGPLAHVKRHK